MQKIIFENFAKSLDCVLKVKESKSILVFCSKRGESILKKTFIKSLQNASFFINITPNPKVEDIKNALKSFESTKFSHLVAFGGGSVIDFAKGFKHFGKLDSSIIAIPSTAGSGSESTQFAVAYENGKKYSLDSKELLPEVAIVDSALLLDCPKFLRASSGIDCLCQAIESYFAIKSTQQSRIFATEAMNLCAKNLVAFVNGDNAKADSMAKAANLAGQAINISRTTAAHALSYAFSINFGIPHGAAVALSMADLIESNMSVNNKNCLDSRGVEFVRQRMQEILSILDCKDSKDFRVYWHNLMDSIGLEKDIKKLGISDKKPLIEAVNVERLANNPVDLSDKLALFYEGGVF